MPVITTPGPLERFQILRVTNPYSFAEWAGCVRELLAAPVFLNSHAILVDRRDADPLTAQIVDEMTHFFAQHKRQLDGARTAIVVSDETAFGMSRMTELKAQAQNVTLLVRAFRDYEEAVHWLVQMGGGVTGKLSHDDQARLVDAALQGGDVRCHHGGEWIWKKMSVVVGPDLYACGPSRRDCPEVSRDQRG